MGSRSSTEAEFIAVDDKIIKVIWSKRFTEEQGFKVSVNIIFHDNSSTINLEENGKFSSGKRTRHFDIRLLHVADLISRKEVVIKHCPIENILADYFSKQLVRKTLCMIRSKVMNVAPRE